MERLIMIRAAFDTGFISALALSGLAYIIHTVLG